MTWKALATAIYLYLSPAPQAHQASRMGAMVWEEAERYEVEPEILAAVVIYESSFKPEVVGKLGELGLGQIRRGLVTRGFEEFTDEELMSPRMNLRLTARHLAYVHKICGGEPIRWLSPYNGRWCGESGYSRRIMQIVEELRDLATRVDVIDIKKPKPVK